MTQRQFFVNICNYYYYYTRLTALFPGLPRWASTRKVKPIWILLKQQTMSGSGISWAICKSAPRSRQITMPAPHHSVFTGQMPFLLPNQQHQSTEGAWRNAYKINKHQYRLLLVTFYANNKHQPWQSKHWGRTSATVMQSEETPSPLLQAICPWHSIRYHILH